MAVRKRVFDHIRERLLLPVNALNELKNISPLSSLSETENHKKVWKLCNNRMILGAFRYGLFKEREEEYAKEGRMSYDCISEAYRRIALYEEDGNKEWLLDAINVLAMEFRLPSHPNAHFTPTDDIIHAEKRIS